MEIVRQRVRVPNTFSFIATPKDFFFRNDFFTTHRISDEKQLFEIAHQSRFSPFSLRLSRSAISFFLFLVTFNQVY